MRLAGKIAIVTGAGQGIGRACAERLAQDGCKVAVSDINETSGREVVSALAKSGGEAFFQVCDVGSRTDVDALVAATVSRFGRLDIMVANAGILDDRPFLDLEEAEFDRILRTNLKGAFLCGQAAARQMVKQPGSTQGGGSGAIVNMSSVNAWFGLPDHVAYTVSKGGIMQLTKAMAIALAPHGIRVNAVGPGTIETPLIKDVVKDEAFRQRVLSRTPLGRYGQPAEIAAIVAWLASDESSYVTGTTIYADGGRMPLNYVVPVKD
jgi:NAD(P)-dependent dehydrogenase (short-subunit alcohol dehydrogenase family)